MAEPTLQPPLLESAPAATTGPVECLGLTFPNDDARRAYFTEQLRAHLQDPAFRQIEGFPIGSDEDILALSDPPIIRPARIHFWASLFAITANPMIQPQTLTAVSLLPPT